MATFSIIITCQNDAAGLAATIRSVGNQSFPHVQCIVQDRRSNDDTAEIVKAYRDWVNAYHSDKDRGINDAMNKAVSHATGDFTIFLSPMEKFVDNDVLDRLDHWLSTTDQIVLEPGADSTVTGSMKDYPFGNIFAKRAFIAKTELLRKFPFDVEMNAAGELDFFTRCQVANARVRSTAFAILERPPIKTDAMVFLDRFMECDQILLKRFANPVPEFRNRLRNELLEYIDNEFGTQTASGTSNNGEIRSIIDEINQVLDQMQLQNAQA